MYDTFIPRLDAILQCDPANCKGNDCPLFRSEDGKCNINQFLVMFNCVMKEKFENVNKYNPLN